MSGDGKITWLVATSCDDRYLWPWACSLHSAVTSADVPFRVLVANVNNFLSSQGQRIAEDVLRLLEINGDIIDISLDVGKVDKYDWNATVYARLGLMDQLNERFMWLDSDTILRPGWQTIFDYGEQLMEEPGIIAGGVLDRLSTLEQLRSLGTNQAYEASQGQYFNAGVLLVDPIRWRENGMNLLWGGLVQLQSERGFIYQDQDILNYLLVNHLALLPSGFNHIVSEPASGTESILHYAGFPKPWRLTERGKAFFVATEALNYDRPRQQISGGGSAWELFPTYWEAERQLLETLKAKGAFDLIDLLIELRLQNLLESNFQEKLKFRGLRFLSRKLLP